MDAPAGTHQPIVYPAAVLRACMNPNAAKEFVNYLASPAARAVFLKYGFRPAAK
jgi:molybdate transport system substrate-binding protein